MIWAWLSEPTIDLEERIGHGLSEQVYNAMELKRLRPEGEDAQTRIDRWKQIDADFNWSLTMDRDRPLVDGAKRPFIPEGIDGLVLGDARRLGRLQSSYLSAVARVTGRGCATPSLNARNAAMRRDSHSQVWAPPPTRCSPKPTAASLGTPLNRPSFRGARQGPAPPGRPSPFPPTWQA